MTSLNKIIHGRLKQLGIDEDDRRAYYLRVVGKDSQTKMTDAEKELVADELGKMISPSSANAKKPAPRDMDSPYLPKMRAMWIALYNLGAVDDRRDSAIKAWVLGRQVRGIDAVRWIRDAEHARSVVEGMKAIMTRNGVVWSDLPGAPKYKLHHGYKIAVAQWAILHPGKKDSLDRFWDLVTGIIDAPDGYRDLTDRQWIDVMNYFGKQVRAHKKAQAGKAGA